MIHCVTLYFGSKKEFTPTRVQSLFRITLVCFVGYEFFLGCERKRGSLLRKTHPLMEDNLPLRSSRGSSTAGSSRTWRCRSPDAAARGRRRRPCFTAASSLRRARPSARSSLSFWGQYYRTSFAVENFNITYKSSMIWGNEWVCIRQIKAIANLTY